MELPCPGCAEFKPELFSEKCECAAQPPEADCPAYFQGKICPLNPSLISHCDTKPCKVIIANWLPKME